MSKFVLGSLVLTVAMQAQASGLSCPTLFRIGSRSDLAMPRQLEPIWIVRSGGTVRVSFDRIERLVEEAEIEARDIDNVFVDEAVRRLPTRPGAPVRGPFVARSPENAEAFVRHHLSAGADLNAAGPRGRTALMYAAITGRTDLIDALVNAGARVDLRDRDGRTAADYSMLLRQAPEPGARAVGGRSTSDAQTPTRLFYQTHYQAVNGVVRLNEAENLFLNAKYIELRGLHRAGLNFDTLFVGRQKIESFTDRTANANVDVTFMEQAAARNNVSMVRFLLSDLGVRVDHPVTDPRHDNAMSSALRESDGAPKTERKQIVEALLNHGADINVPILRPNTMPVETDINPVRYFLATVLNPMTGADRRVLALDMLTWVIRHGGRADANLDLLAENRRVSVQDYINERMRVLRATEPTTETEQLHRRLLSLVGHAR